MISAVMAEVKVLDYSNSRVVAIDTGTAKLRTGAVKLIHVIDLDNYQNFIDSMKEALATKIIKSHPLNPLLSLEISLLQDKLNQLKPRSKRSLNFIGSAWKWIAGNPDHDDFEIIEKKINNVLKNNNKQVVINKLSSNRINELTSKINKIVQNEARTLQNLDFTEFKYKLEIMKEEIINLQYAIHWAKVGVINSFILSHNEIETIERLFKTNEINYLNVEELLEFSEVRIASNKNSLIYIVSIPITDNVTCNRLLIRPVKTGNIVTKIKFNEVLKCNKKIFGIKIKCKSYNMLTMCTDDDIEDISASQCLPKLIHSKPSNCTFINNSHIPTVQEILPGTLLLNQFNGTILISQEPYNLTGTFVIKFHNETVQVNGTTFSFSEINFSSPLPAMVQSMIKNPHVEEVLSLELIKELHTNNTEAIQLLNVETKLGDAIAYVLAIFAITIMLSVCLKKKCDKRKLQCPKTININTSNTPVPPQYITTAANGFTRRPIERIGQIPYF